MSEDNADTQIAELKAVIKTLQEEFEAYKYKMDEKMWHVREKQFHPSHQYSY